MGLVQLCLSLEEKADELGFEFDWTETAMSRSRGMFRSVDSLSEEFVSQYNEKDDNRNRRFQRSWEPYLQKVASTG